MNSVDNLFGRIGCVEFSGINNIKGFHILNDEFHVVIQFDALDDFGKRLRIESKDTACPQGLIVGIDREFL